MTPLIFWEKTFLCYTSTFISSLPSAVSLRFLAGKYLVIRITRSELRRTGTISLTKTLIFFRRCSGDSVWR
ncbi:hypothetical protein ACET3Z_008330 [Daucus carota]